MSFDLGRNIDAANARWQHLWIFFAFLLGISCAITAAFPAIDLTVSRWFFDPLSGTWPIAKNPFWQVVRKVLWRLADLSPVAAVAVIIIRAMVPRWRKSGRSAAGFLALSYLLGPGLLVNVLLKEYWGRARPFDVAEFGGDHLFTPALTVTNQCAHNCSFVGGEASSFAALFFVLFFMLSADLHIRKARRVLGAALCVAVFGSLLRVAFGHHFLSDIFFAWATMFLVVTAIAAVFDHFKWDYRWHANVRVATDRNRTTGDP